ncbi:MAG: response regulator [Woeseia sp.]|nr:response regulator [Woeseia sp.]MBT8096954.1 response regulator [Woeseia sp.]NNE61223.1 response regulator [Woeseia sp.]NNL54509.1 response regulator [Woeseia sp.]
MSERADKAKRVLIVEDEAAAREASERYLGFVGHDVATAADANEAFARATAVNPEVAICDWRLGGGPDGTVVARELQQRYGTSIIFVTAHPLDELRDVTEDIRVTRYLRKPVQFPQLIEAIDAAHA